MVFKNRLVCVTSIFPPRIAPMSDRMMPGMNMGYMPNGTIRSSRLNQNNVMSQPFANAVVPQGFAGYPGMGPTVMLDPRLGNQCCLIYICNGHAWVARTANLVRIAQWLCRNPIPVMMILCITRNPCQIITMNKGKIFPRNSKKFSMKTIRCIMVAKKLW